MADLIVLAFKDESVADDVISQIQAMQAEGLIDVADWARVIRDENGRIDVRQATNTAGAGALGGALFGVLFGLLFLMPVAGTAIGAAMGALIGKLSDYGINDRFVKEVANQLKPGTSALFLYVLEATIDKVVERLHEFEPRVLRTSLSQQAEAELRSAIEAHTTTTATP